MTVHHPAGTFRILYVCSANVCRSVIAERLSRRDLTACAGTPAARFAVGSAGTDGLDGLPMHPCTTYALGALGADTSGFSSRRLTSDLVDGADLILTAGLEHRDAVVAARPRLSRRTYLIREFARLVRHVPGSRAADPVDRASELVSAAARLRGRIPWADPVTDEIADPPVTRPAFLACARSISGSITDVVAALRGGAGGPGMS